MDSVGDGADRLFERALALAEGYRQADAERLLQRALARLGAGRTASGLTRERVLISLANVRAERGHVSEGMEILDALAGGVPEGLSGLVHSQRGLLRLRAGRVAEAMADLDIAVETLGEHERPLAVALLNRGWLHLSGGALEAARSDLERCLQVTERAGLVIHRAKARHNLGYLAFLAGDLPLALAEMSAAHADRIAVAVAAGREPDVDAMYHLDRARVLFTAGLEKEADADLEVAAAAFAALGSRQDQAECELSRAQVALAERPAHAVLMADRARRRFARRGAMPWAHLAELVGLRARLALGRPPARIARAAAGLVPLLRTDGLAEDARIADLLSISAGVAAGGGRAAVQLGRDVPMSRGDGILTRLYAREVRAEVALASGRHRAAAAQLRAGLVELHRYQASFGSIDLQTAVGRHGRVLAARGVATALVRGSPSGVFAWSERSRALASRLPPVRPPSDPVAAELLEQLRYVRMELRDAELAGRDEPQTRARRADLERRIRQHSWYLPGPGDVEEPVTLAAVRAALGDDGCLVVHLVSARQLHALVVTPERARLVPIGRTEGLMELLRRTRADLDALAVGRLPEPIRHAVQRSASRALERLDRWLWTPIAALAGTGPLVLVPSGALTGVPWTMLPGLRGRPLSTARTATAWARAREVTRSAEGSRPRTPRGERVVLAAGPGLLRAETEAREAGRLWAGSRVLLGAAATGPAVLESMADAHVLHLAAHGSHEAENPLFSSVQLADGPLFGYDLAGTPAPPHVVLSACDLGLATARPGDELLGMTAVLLQAGATCVVASVARIADEVARTVIVDYHARVRAGCLPSVALSEAIRDRGDAPFVCFGAGW